MKNSTIKKDESFDIKGLITNNSFIILSAYKQDLCIFAANDGYQESISTFIQNNLFFEAQEITSKIEKKQEESEGKKISKGEKIAIQAMKPIFRQMLTKGAICVYHLKDRAEKDRFFMAVFKNENMKYEEEYFKTLMEINVDTFFDNF